MQVLNILHLLHGGLTSLSPVRVDPWRGVACVANPGESRAFVVLIERVGRGESFALRSLAFSRPCVTQAPRATTAVVRENTTPSRKAEPNGREGDGARDSAARNVVGRSGAPRYIR